MQTELRTWFPEDLIQCYPLGDPLSSSSSPIPVVSVGSSKSSCLSFDMVTTCYRFDSIQDIPIEQATKPSSAVIPTHLLAMQDQSQLYNIHLSTPAGEDEAMARAMIAAMTSPASSSSSYHSQIPTHQHEACNRSAFRNYDSALAPNVGTRPTSYGQNKIKRLIGFSRSIRMQMQETRPTSNQLNHMISERRRREKLNESFQELRALLPPGSKNDKASVLANTRDYLSGLKAEVVDLMEKKRSLESRLSSEKEVNEESGSNFNERLAVEVVEASESSSEERQIELRVIVREEDCNVIDLVLHLLQCLKQMRDVSLASIDANTLLQQLNLFNRAIFRLNFKASKWNQQSLKEAMTRAVADLAHGGKPILTRPLDFC